LFTATQFTTIPLLSWHHYLVLECIQNRELKGLDSYGASLGPYSNHGAVAWISFHVSFRYLLVYMANANTSTELFYFFYILIPPISP